MKPNRLPKSARWPRRRTIGQALVALLLLNAAGCQHARSIRNAPFPDQQVAWMEGDQEVSALHQQIEDLFENTAQLSEKVDDLDALLKARNIELRQRRNEHQYSLEQISKVQEQMEMWRESINELRVRLAEEEQSRAEKLDQLTRRLEVIGDAVGMTSEVGVETTP